MSFFAEDILNKNRSASPSTVTEATKGTVAGAAIGLIGGAIYAFFYQKKYLPSMGIGAVAGGVISRIFITK